MFQLMKSLEVRKYDLVITSVPFGVLKDEQWDRPLENKGVAETLVRFAETRSTAGYVTFFVLCAWWQHTDMMNQ